MPTPVELPGPPPVIDPAQSPIMSYSVLIVPTDALEMLISAKPPVSPSVIDPEEPPVMPIVALVGPPPPENPDMSDMPTSVVLPVLETVIDPEEPPVVPPDLLVVLATHLATRHLDVYHLVILGSLQPFHLLHKLTHIIQKCLLLKGLPPVQPYKIPPVKDPDEPPAIPHEVATVSPLEDTDVP